MNFPHFNAKAGKLVKRWATFGKESIEFNYFLPEKLPEMKDLCNDLSLMEKSNEANRAIGELQGLTKNIGNIDLFTDPYMRKEAVDSSEIEGTFVSLTDVFLSEAGSKKPEFSNPNVREVVNFVNAIKSTLARLRVENKMSKEMINEMHRKLLEDTRGKEKLVGDYRKQQNWIKNKGATNDILDSDFIPPSEEKVEELMEYLFSYINGDNGHMRLIKAALLHYYFETIHPYEDGNGRVGRTLIPLYLIQARVLEEPILYLSPYFKKNKEVYYSLLMEVRETGDYNKWIKFFLDGVTEVAIKTSAKVKRLIELYNGYKKRLTELHATPISFALLDKFFERPYWYITHLEETLNENYPKTKRGIGYLVKCGAISEFTLYARNKIFVANEVYKILDEDLV